MGKARLHPRTLVEVAGLGVLGGSCQRFGVMPGQEEPSMWTVYTERRNQMKQKIPVIKRSRDIEDLHHLRLMALLREVVRDYGYKGAARVLEIDPQTVTSSAKSGQLTHRVRESLERALQHGVGSAADRQRERSDKLEKRLDKMEDQLKEVKENLRSSLKSEKRLDKVEGQLKELKENLRSGLKESRMSLDGVRKYYTVQRRLVEQRLLFLEGGGEGTETGSSAGDESGDPETRSVAF